MPQKRASDDLPLPARRRAATIGDVARLAGCSKGVVSAVVNQARGNIAVSAATRRRVLAAAQELGYRPNFASQSLFRRSTRTVGIYAPPEASSSLGYPYEGRILCGIERACREHGYDLLALNLTGPIAPAQCAARLAEGRVDGVILIQVPHDAAWPDVLLRQTSNLVAVNYYGAAALDTVRFDDRTAAALAVRHLAALGHRRIGYIGAAHHDLGPGQGLRCHGYLDAMAGLGLPVAPAWVWDLSCARPGTVATAGWDLAEAAAGADQMLELGAERPTALLFYDDGLAAVAIQRLAERGVRVPQDISVVGIDDSEIARLTYPRLTSVRQPLEDMGHRATQLLLAKAAPPAAAAGACELWPPDLVVRQSSAPPPPAG
ncbi:MAG: LacI family DNA-binding transcriptional regulator [Lentisphaeria bacterium]